MCKYKSNNGGIKNIWSVPEYYQAKIPHNFMATLTLYRTKLEWFKNDIDEVDAPAFLITMERDRYCDIQPSCMNISRPENR